MESFICSVLLYMIVKIEYKQAIYIFWEQPGRVGASAKNMDYCVSWAWFSHKSLYQHNRVFFLPKVQFLKIKICFLVPFWINSCFIIVVLFIITIYLFLIFLH